VNVCKNRNRILLEGAKHAQILARLREEADDAPYGGPTYEERQLKRPYRRENQKNFMTREYMPVMGEGHKVRKKDKKRWRKIYDNL
jgi:hypothetical protein